MYKHIFCVIIMLVLFTMCGSKGSSDKQQDGKDDETGVWDVTNWDESRFVDKVKPEIEDTP